MSVIMNAFALRITFQTACGTMKRCHFFKQTIIEFFTILLSLDKSDQCNQGAGRESSQTRSKEQQKQNQVRKMGTYCGVCASTSICHFHQFDPFSP
jgi:hypothetical protein